MEMTDRELLELAAKAAGLKHVDYTGINYDGRFGIVLVDDIGRQLCDWKPLTDDGDALRLAVKLGIGIDFDFSDCCGETSAAQTLQEYQYEKHGNDPFSATRRAIVRAAAEIGKGMECLKQ
jgi:hypothetical protein